MKHLLVISNRHLCPRRLNSILIISLNLLSKESYTKNKNTEYKLASDQDRDHPLSLYNKFLCYLQDLINPKNYDHFPVNSGKTDPTLDSSDLKVEIADLIVEFFLRANETSVRCNPIQFEKTNFHLVKTIGTNNHNLFTPGHTEC